MIVVEGLTRAFDAHVAVEDVSFTVAEGQLLALLGPNGAGKTTTVRMLMGLIAPTRGRATVAGHQVSPTPGDRSALRATCGLLTETPGFYDRLSGWDNIVFFARLYRLQSRGLNERLEQQLRSMELWDARERLVGTYSKGMKQRLALIRSLFHEPRVVFFDEPTSGLDPEAAASVRSLILSLKGQGRTIVVCTHNLDEAARLADVIGIMRRRLLRFEPIATLRGAKGVEQLIRVRLAAPMNLALTPEALGGEGITRVELSEPTLLKVWTDDGPRRTPGVVRALVERGAQIADVRADKRSLESIYLEIIREQGSA